MQDPALVHSQVTRDCGSLNDSCESCFKIAAYFLHICSLLTVSLLNQWVLNRFVLLVSPQKCCESNAGATPVVS